MKAKILGSCLMLIVTLLYSIHVQAQLDPPITGGGTNICGEPDIIINELREVYICIDDAINMTASCGPIEPTGPFDLDGTCFCRVPCCPGGGPLYITYQVVDPNTGQTQNCNISVDIPGCSAEDFCISEDTQDSIIIGMACDDGDPNTIGDVINDECECVGEPNSCEDVVLDDGCPLTQDVLMPDCTVLHLPPDVDDGCNGTTDWFDQNACLVIHDPIPCDDGDPKTNNDEYDINCECHGENSCNLNSWLNSDVRDDVEEYADIINENGSVMFNGRMAYEIGIDNVLSLFSLSQLSSFELVYDISGKIDGSTRYQRFQQYHDGVKVFNRGYNLIYKTPTGGPGPGPNGPCDQSYSIVPSFGDDINISPDPTILKEEIEGNTSYDSNPELIISDELSPDCSYLLAWKTKSGKYDVFIDAHTGVILKTWNSNRNIPAPTVDYGSPVLLDDTTNGSHTELITFDGRITTTDGTNDIGNANKDNVEDWNLPETDESSWSDMDARLDVFQTHYIAGKVLPIIDDIMLDMNLSTFEEIYIGVCRGALGAVYLRKSNLEKVYLRFRSSSEINTTAFYDVMGHELGHAIISPMINDDGNESRAINEGFADVFGAFIEYKIKGTTDWALYTDTTNPNHPNIPPNFDWDVSNPEFACPRTSQHTTNHEWGRAISYLFYGMTVGNPNKDIDPLGIDLAFDIMMETLAGLPQSPSFQDVYDVINVIVMNTFEPCSAEAKNIRKALESFCFGPTGIYFDNCEFHIDYYSNLICEERPRLLLCLDGPIPNDPLFNPDHFTWHTRGHSNFTSETNPQGGSYTHDSGLCLQLTGFPDFPYYPQRIRLEVTHPSPLMPKVTRTITIRDCDGSGPTCEEYYGIGRLTDDDSNNDNLSSIIDTKHINHSESPNILVIYSISGQRVFSGENSTFHHINLTPGLYIHKYIDETTGQFIIEKKYHN